MSENDDHYEAIARGLMTAREPDAGPKCEFCTKPAVFRFTTPSREGYERFGCADHAGATTNLVWLDNGVTVTVDKCSLEAGEAGPDAGTPATDEPRRFCDGAAEYERAQAGAPDEPRLWTGAELLADVRKHAHLFTRDDFGRMLRDLASLREDDDPPATDESAAEDRKQAMFEARRMWVLNRGNAYEPRWQEAFEGGWDSRRGAHPAVAELARISAVEHGDERVDGETWMRAAKYWHDNHARQEAELARVREELRSEKERAGRYALEANAAEEERDAARAELDRMRVRAEAVESELAVRGSEDLDD